MGLLRKADRCFGGASEIPRVKAEFVVFQEPWIEGQLVCDHVQVRKRKPRHIVLVLHEGMKIGKAGDFGLHDDGLNLAIEREVSARTRAVEAGLFHALDLDLADPVAHPLASFGLLRFEINAGAWLREHDLGQVPIDHFELSLSLEAEDDRIVALAILGQRGCQLRKALQAREFVEHEPNSFLVRLRLIEQPHHQHVDPHALQGLQRCAFGRQRSDEDPALPGLRPFGRRPLSVAFAALRKQPQTLRHLAERSEYAHALRTGGLIDVICDLGSCDSLVDLGRVAHPLE